MTPLRNRYGLTVLELLVALVILGAATTAGYQAFAALIDGRERAASRTREAMDPVVLRLQLTAWLRGAHLLSTGGGPPFRGLDGEFDGLPDASLSFLTNAETPAGTGETLVRLYVDRDEKTPEQGLTAELSSWPDRKTTRLVLDSAVAGLRFEYTSYAVLRGGSRPSWISSTLLPSEIEAELLLRPGDSLRAVLRQPIRVAVRNGA
ncbi:MAG: PulJ/GspJ family protein [Gemmatimonadales bacterium]